MTSHKCQYDLIFKLKMKLVKEPIRHCLLFCFHQKKSAANAHRIIWQTYGENIIIIRTCANYFKRFKNDDFDINDKKRSCSCGRRRMWKDKEVVEINGKYFDLYCIDIFYCKKITAKNRQKLMHRSHIKKSASFFIFLSLSLSLSLCRVTKYVKTYY